ncbi:CpaF family protein [Aliivibrio sp. SR45-2]|uniref:CpaF family protein n=2 Tax=Aliivibrio TaxID=511678 RepID=UPI0015F82867|nr:ATPase, T2SS/T4P/T4SS family [Aliivibrio sp. SR45-2]MBB1313468.1 CpaF family protein [Aliivibrio sp. SR45-2]
MNNTISTIFGEVPIAKQYEWQWVEDNFKPLKKWFQCEGVTEIFVDRFDSISIERNGKIEKTDSTFGNEQTLQNLITQIALCLNQTLTDESPIMDARLPDCSRLCCTMPSVTPQGATITLRVAPKDLISLEQLVEFKTLSADMANTLQRHIEQGSNLIVSGNTGSGKTTLLRALARFIPLNERIITCEDTQELYLDWLRYRVSLEAPNRKGSEVEMKNLIETALRMRPDRIWVGEIRKAAAADAFLQAINTGHSGCVTTIHANNTIDAVSRLQYLIASQGLISFELAEKQIMGSVNVLIHASRHADYGRRITEITEIKNGKFIPVFTFNPQTMEHEIN